MVVLHVGADRTEYDRGHLPGARFLPVGAITRETAGNPNEPLSPPIEPPLVGTLHPPEYETTTFSPPSL